MLQSMLAATDRGRGRDRHRQRARTTVASRRGVLRGLRRIPGAHESGDPGCAALPNALYLTDRHTNGHETLDQPRRTYMPD